MTPAMPARTPSAPQPELLALVRSIHLGRETGLVEIEAEGSDKHLYFVTGELYLLATTPLARRIARLLKMQRWGDQGSQQALALLYARVAERFSRWHAHSFTFTEGSEAPAKELVGPLPTARILTAAASERSSLERLELRLGAAGLKIAAEERGARPPVTAIGPAEAMLLSSLGEPKALDEVLPASEARPEVFARLARLWVVGLIREVPEAAAPPATGESASTETPTGLAEADGGRAPVREEIQEIWRRHFGLAGDPFSLTPDPAFLFVSEGHAEALAGLKLGLLERRGLLAMTGEVGTGKTTLLYTLLSGLDPEIDAAYVYNTTLSCEEILQSALMDFGVPYASDSRLDLLQALNDYLARLAATNRTAALVIDEAQNLDDETFEQLRLLLNFETFERKLLQIVLVGQPELARRLRAPGLRQIADRVAVRCHLDPLSKEEACKYVRHRLEAAGATSDLFSRRALKLVATRSHGVPRRINVVCHNAMLFAYAADEREVSPAFVREALRESRISLLERVRRLPGLGKGENRPGARESRGSASAARTVLVWALGLAFAGWLALTLGGSPGGRQDSGTAPVDSPDSAGAAVLDSPARPAARPVEPPADDSDGQVLDSQTRSQVSDGPPGQATSRYPAMGVTTGTLNLRSAAGLQAPILETLPPGSWLRVLEAREVLGPPNERRVWLRVITADAGRSGWVSSRFVREIESTSRDPSLKDEDGQY